MMRRVVPTSRFKRDLKRELKGQYRQLLLADEFNAVLETLQKDETLAEKYRDHNMSGDFAGCRNCHIRPDLVLLYEKMEADKLLLVRPGSHAVLGI